MCLAFLALAHQPRDIRTSCFRGNSRYSTQRSHPLPGVRCSCWRPEDHWINHGSHVHLVLQTESRHCQQLRNFLDSECSAVLYESCWRGRPEATLYLFCGVQRESLAHLHLIESEPGSPSVAASREKQPSVTPCIYFMWRLVNFVLSRVAIPNLQAHCYLPHRHSVIFGNRCTTYLHIGHCFHRSQGL